MSPANLAVKWSRLSNAAKTVTTTPPCGLASGCSRTTPSSRRRSTWCPRRPGCPLALKLWHHTLLHHSLNKFPSPTMSPVASTKPKQLIQISVLMQVDNIIPNPKMPLFTPYTISNGGWATLETLDQTLNPSTNCTGAAPLLSPCLWSCFHSDLQGVDSIRVNQLIYWF